jgi:hypothetical protein
MQRWTFAIERSNQGARDETGPDAPRRDVTWRDLKNRGGLAQKSWPFCFQPPRGKATTTPSDDARPSASMTMCAATASMIRLFSASYPC